MTSNLLPGYNDDQYPDDDIWCDTCGNLGILPCDCGEDTCSHMDCGSVDCPDCG